jgi:uncharacterized membrane protein
MSIPGDIAGGVFGLILISIYILMIVLTISVLICLVILLPVLTKLAKLWCERLEPQLSQPDKGRRLLQVEEMLRRKQITPEEYAAKRQDILDNL